MALKSDAAEILEHMEQLPSSLRLGGSRSSWPHWLYRSDHVENAAAILNGGQLVSRARAESESLIRVDSGSPYYVGQLSDAHRNLVRLYFRPRTPTQYRNEGIRPASRIEYEAHMPVPVYLLFKSSLLAEEGVLFSKGRLEETTEIGDSAEFLKSIDFGDVYHDGPVGPPGGSGRRPEILNARNSEVLIEGQLPLGKLRHIVCRSGPERDTLLNLLSPVAYDRWLKRIHTDEGDRRLFHKRGTFVERVSLSATESRFSFYSNTQLAMRGPFGLRMEWFWSGQKTTAVLDRITVSERPVVGRLGQALPEYRVCVWLDDSLAYVGTFDEEYESEMLV